MRDLLLQLGSYMIAAAVILLIWMVLGKLRLEDGESENAPPPPNVIATRKNEGR